MKRLPVTPFGVKWGSDVRDDVTSHLLTPPPVSPPAPEHRAQGTFVPHGGTAAVKKTYSGTKILGIGTMHKSNAVPVFSQEEAEDIAKMRRG